MIRTVKAFEANQERASETVERIARLGRKLLDRSFETKREADRMVAEKPRNKRIACDATAIRQKADHDQARGLKLCDRARGVRYTSDRWGRMKARIGVYDRTWGWREALSGEIPHAQEHGIRAQ